MKIITITKTIFFVFISAAILFSCKENYKAVVPFNYNSLNVIKIPEYLTDLGKDSIINNISFIRLETNDSCLIGKVSQVLSDSSYLFIVDKEEHNLLKFSKNGKFSKKIGRSGIGKGYYLTLDFVMINKEKHQLSLLDLQGQKELVYNYEGDLIKEESIKFAYNAKEEISDNFFIYHTGLLSNNGNITKSNQIVIYNKKENRYYNEFPYSKYIKDSFSLQAPIPLQKSLNQVYYYNMLTPDTIWMFKGNEIQAVFALDFTDKVRNKINDEAALIKEVKTPSVKQSFSGQYFITKDYLSITIVNKDKTMHPLFYSKTTGKVKYGYENYDLNQVQTLSLFDLINDIFPLGTIDDHLFYQVVEPYKLLKQKKGCAPQLYKKIISTDRILLDSIKETDNPILMFYELKPF